MYKKQRKNKKFKETGDSRYIYQNELDKACFQHDMASGDFENLTKRIALIKSCMIKHLILLKVRIMRDINADLLQWPINLLMKKSCGSGIKNEKISNQQLAEKLHKPIIKKIEEKKSTLTFHRQYLGC